MKSVANKVSVDMSWKDRRYMNSMVSFSFLSENLNAVEIIIRPIRFFLRVSVLAEQHYNEKRLG